MVGNYQKIVVKHHTTPRRDSEWEKWDVSFLCTTVSWHLLSHLSPCLNVIFEVLNFYSFLDSYYAKLKKMEEEKQKELAEKYRDRVIFICKFSCIGKIEEFTV